MLRRIYASHPDAWEFSFFMSYTRHAMYRKLMCRNYVQVRPLERWRGDSNYVCTVTDKGKAALTA
jgi:hypothetical protein